jgi:hypothetical protein
MFVATAFASNRTLVSPTRMAKAHGGISASVLICVPCRLPTTCFSEMSSILHETSVQSHSGLRFGELGALATAAEPFPWFSLLETGGTIHAVAQVAVRSIS